MSDKPALYRKRLIPAECVLLDKDVVLRRDENLLVTSWNTIRPKKDLHHGISCFLLDKGWKISRFLTRENELLCWYCDIIEHTYEPETDTYVFTDLLADVILYPNGDIRVVDLDELADALEQKLLKPEEICSCMRRLNALLTEIYSGQLLPSLEDYWPS